GRRYRTVNFVSASDIPRDPSRGIRNERAGRRDAARDWPARAFYAIRIPNDDRIGPDYQVARVLGAAVHQRLNGPERGPLRTPLVIGDVSGLPSSPGNRYPARF
ncbi:hypothetical protein GWI33_022958, partial [Rhynchophorus ferrugineus]